MDGNGMAEHEEDIDMESVESSNVGKSEATTSGTSLTSDGHTSDNLHVRHRSESVDMIESHPVLDINGSQADGQTRPRRMPPTDLPPIDEQVEKVLALSKEPLVEDAVVYIVSTQWLNRAISRSSHASQGGKIEKSATQGEIGPVDSSDLATQGRLPNSVGIIQSSSADMRLTRGRIDSRTTL
jgi:hypothetical protein